VTNLPNSRPGGRGVDTPCSSGVRFHREILIDYLFCRYQFILEPLPADARQIVTCLNDKIMDVLWDLHPPRHFIRVCLDLYPSLVLGE
jgi:hypothetical protein